MIESRNGAMADVQPRPEYQAHTVEILYAVASVLVLCVTIYLVFFDGWSGI